MNYQNIKTALLVLFILTGVNACSSDVGGNTDRSAGTITLTSLNDGNGGDDVVGLFTLTWDNTEPNRSRVDIELSSDSGETYDTVVESRLADTGSYEWDTNSVTDCRKCRIRITGTDIVGNATAPADSAQDFVINNVPQVLGSAIYYDMDNDGVGDGDTIVIPFDKEVDLRSSVAGDVFFLPVAGDDIGPFSTMKIGSSVKEVVITINDIVSSPFHLHVSKAFDATKTRRTAASGLDILENLAGDIIFSIETGRAAEPSGDGIDIAPTFGEVLPAPLSLTSSTVAVAMADLDDDDDLDIIRINTSADNSILINNGPAAWLDDDVDTTNNFTTSQALGNANNTSVAVADIDGANGPDIVIGNSATNLVFLNNGSAVFAAQAQPISFTSIAGTQAVALADVDNANGVDVIVGINGANRVLLNNGGGSFTDSGQMLGSSDTLAIAMGDIDGDGDQDMITANNGVNRVWTNSGVHSGNFVDSGQSLGSDNTRALVLVDIDADGDLDMIAGNGDGAPNRVWRNTGGVFSEDVPAQTLGDSDTFALAMSDVDRDGDLDLIAGNNEQSDRVWFNDGVGVFSDSGQRLNTEIAISTATYTIAIGDLDGDSDVDLLIGTFNASSTDTIWLNSMRTATQAIFINASQPLGSNSTNAMAAGDVNGDGLLDVVTANRSGEGNRVYFSDARGLFSDSGQSLGAADTTSIVLVDIDGDGDLDIIAGNSTAQANQVWLNDNANPGQFTVGDQFGSSNTISIAFGDIDNDNDIDIVAGNSSSQANRVWRNTGSGVFNDADMTSLGDTANTQAIVLADVDNNGSLDIVTGNSGAANRVYLNTAGVFVDSGQALGGSSATTSIAMGDIDNDGDLDMVEGVSGQANRVWINNINNLPGQEGVFVNSGQALGGTNITISVDLADIDADGDLDLITGNLGAPNRIYINSGVHSGLFVDAGQTFDSGFNDNTFSVVFVDIDNDGDPDILTGNDAASFGVNQLWLNDF